MSRTEADHLERLEYMRTHTIYGDVYEPDGLNLPDLIKDIRSVLVKQRGRIEDMRNAKWHTTPEHVIGGLTCIISALYYDLGQAEKYVLARTKGVKWQVRGIGLDGTPGCFVCGATVRSGEAINDYMNNIAAFVTSKEDGEQVVSWFKHGARLDYRDYEPNWIQVKIGSCDEHLPNLTRLGGRWYVTPELVQAAVAG